MSSFYDDASLVMIPSCYKVSTVLCEKPTDGSGDLTFTRTGDTATRVNSSGLVEKVRTNLLTYSNDFSNAAWDKQNVTLTAGQTDPNGGTTATTVDPTNTTSAYLRQIKSITSGVKYTWSVYIKGSTTGQSIALYTDGASNIYEVKALTTSWQRFTGVATAASSGSSGFYILAGSGYSGLTDLPFNIAFAQVEASDVVTNYISTTTAAVSVGPVANLPRLDYLNSSCPRLLLEPQRTNTILWSEQINTTNWPGSTRINVTANALVSPDGYQNADVIIPNTTSGNHGPAQNVSGLTSGATYSCSIYAKAQGYSKFLILAGAGTGSGQYEFDLTAGTAQAGATITSVGNGWYRCTAPLVPNSSLLQYLIFISNGSAYSYAGNGTSGIAFWGAQVESGNFATSYIPTLASASTRSADATSKTGISSLIGQTEGWIYGEVEGLTNSYGTKSVILSVNDGSSLNRVELSFNATTGYLTPRIYKAGTTIFVVDYFKDSLVTKFKFAIGYGAGRAVFYVNGTKIHEVTSLTFFTSGTLTKVGADNYNGGEAGFGRVSSYLIGTANLTNAQLAELTTL